MIDGSKIKAEGAFFLSKAKWNNLIFLDLGNIFINDSK
jgi:hypothetical protein